MIGERLVSFSHARRRQLPLSGSGLSPVRPSVKFVPYVIFPTLPPVSSIPNVGLLWMFWRLLLFGVMFPLATCRQRSGAPDAGASRHVVARWGLVRCLPAVTQRGSWRRKGCAGDCGYPPFGGGPKDRTRRRGQRAGGSPREKRHYNAVSTYICSRPAGRPGDSIKKSFKIIVLRKFAALKYWSRSELYFAQKQTRKSSDDHKYLIIALVTLPVLNRLTK